MPRSSSRDLSEIFGFGPDDLSPSATSHWKNRTCPFLGQLCTKTNHDQSIIYGACSVVNSGRSSGGSAEEVIICPKRLYANKYQILKEISDSTFRVVRFIAGGDSVTLKSKLFSANSEAIVAFGQNSGKEAQIGGGQLSIDWILQKYEPNIMGGFDAVNFIGVELQSIDITGNYRDNWHAYKDLHDGQNVMNIPASGHGMNWANVHKRLIPQIIRKGNVFKSCKKCIGFFFIVPDIVFMKFEKILGDVPLENKCGKENVSVITYGLGDSVNPGKIRSLVKIREVHYKLENIALSFITNTNPKDIVRFEKDINTLLN